VGEHREKALAAVAETAEAISRRVDGAG